MPEVLSIQDTTWSGPAASFMITRSVVEFDTLVKGAIMVEDGIRKQKTIPRIEVTNLIQKRAATPTSSGNITVDGKVLAPKDYMLYMEMNPRDFEQHFFAEDLTDQLLARELPTIAENYLLMQVMKRLNEFNENAIWRSRIAYDPDGDNLDPTTKGAAAADAAYLYFDGLLTKALSDANTLQVGSPVALTANNIRDAFDDAYALVPNSLLFKYGKGGLKYLVSYADQKKYEKALRVDAFKNQNTTEAGINEFQGYQVVACAGIPENTFFVCVAKPDIDSNNWFGINSMDDNKIELMRLQNNSELFFIKALLKADTQWGFTDQLVIYSTITA